ncbi:MAG: hypothetical protein H8D67_08975, partial [Deltaproteobacteria bacterium]|nr:hypothetical protein [Deltaproteobacteria bacterium]
PHAPFFFKAIGKNVCLEFNQNPMGLVQKLKEIQLLSGDNFSNTIEGVKEKFIEMKLFHHKDPNVGIIKVWKKDYAFLIKAIQQRENKGKINSIFIKPNEIFREDIMKYYYRHVINSLSNREFGSIYKIKQKMKNNKNFQQKIFFEELNNIYAPIYGKNVVRNILGN